MKIISIYYWIQPTLILLFIPVLVLAWHVQISSVKRSITPSPNSVLYSFNLSCNIKHIIILWRHNRHDWSWLYSITHLDLNKNYNVRHEEDCNDVCLWFISFCSTAFLQFALLSLHFSRVDQLQRLMGVWCSLAAKCQQANEKRYLKFLSAIFNQGLGYICCLIISENSTSHSLWLLWKYWAEKLILLFELCVLGTNISAPLTVYNCHGYICILL